ncbi:MAG: hypothetical protein P4L46_07000 [Fimbriimonas sp.]|nr:hypothetical protein [Fimbriimonas sp.]
MILFAAMGLALAGPTWFPFVIPWDDASHTAIDMSYLNAMPAGRNGRIVPRNGHLVEANTQTRVRFLAVDIVGGAAFPSHEDSDRTAAHLAKMGVNLVRFHHLQNPWELESGGSIWKKGHLYLELDPAQLDKLDYLFAALKRHGVYSNINLQTTRIYVPEMGFPESVKQISFELDKRIDKVDRHMIQLQKEYARDLLDRPNPYTGLKYKDDPALAFVEINNENSLVGWPGEPAAEEFMALPEPFRQEVVSKWNKWLAAKYGNDEKVKQTWSQGFVKPGPSILSAASVWTTENQSNGDVKFEVPNPDQSQPSHDGDAPSCRVTVRSNSGPDWHVQLHITGLDLKEGQPYTIRFRARCSGLAQLTVSSALDEPDWHSLGVFQPVKVGVEWQSFALPFTPTDTRTNHNRIGFMLGALRGTLEVESFSVSPGIDPGPLLGGSLNAASIPLPASGIRSRTEDFLRFLCAAETAYSDEMRAYVRKDLGIKANLIDTQVAWGGVTSLVRERDSDYADNHSYWQHPSFPGIPWDSSNWYIANTPMVDAMLDQTDGLTSLAKFRFAGKGYTISEYNHPAPSDYRVEMMPLLSTFAALQDWDGFYLFEYGSFGTGKKNDQIGGYFDVGLDPVRMGFFPSAAEIFRTGIVPPLTGIDRTVVDAKAAELVSTDPWRGKRLNPLSQRLEVTTEGSPKSFAGGESPASLTKVDGGTVYKLQTAKALVLVGQVGGRTETLSGGGITVRATFGQFGRGFVAVTCTPLHTGGYLLTVGSRAENQEMGWNDKRTTIGPNWGHGPIQAEGVPLDLTFTGAPIRHVWALDATGKRKKEIVLGHGAVGTSMHLDPSDATIWYEMGT